MAIGASVIDFSDNDNPYFQTPLFKEMMGRYKLSVLSTIEIRSKIISSSDGGCLLVFVYCPERFNCSHYIISQASVLGLSVKHQALIIDPNEIGIHLKDDIYSIRPYSTTFFPSTLYLTSKDHKTYLIDFDESTLIFDVVATSGWRGPDPRPEVTTRWFLKFNLVESEKGFQSRPPTEGIGYLLNIPRFQQARSNIPLRILRQRIFKDGKIRPIKYYVKNFPLEFQESVQRGFEYWRSFFTSFIGHPLLFYDFIQGDFDGQQEIIAGDIRFNVLEWVFFKQNYEGSNNYIHNRYTGEIWSSNIIIPGHQLVELHQKWFEYSQFVRTLMSTPISELTNSTIPLRSLFGESFQAPYNEKRPLYRNIHLPLSPPKETFNSYMSGSIKNLVAHEVGHSLGLGHNTKASLFAKGIYAGNSQMDDFMAQDNHKPISGEYDRMALAYGYLGTPPERTDMFCDLSNPSPECQADDQGAHPLQNAGAQLQQIIHLLTTRSHPQSPPYLRWNIEVQDRFQDELNIILSFYLSADTHYDQLQSVLIDGRKPRNPQEVKDLVRDVLSDTFCDLGPNNALNLKGTYQYSNPYDRQLQNNVRSFFQWSLQSIRRYIKDFRC